MTETRKLVRFIDEERQRQNLSQRELAERSGMTSPTVSRILSGQTNPTMDSVESLAGGLGFSLVSFLLLVAKSTTGFQDAEMMTVFSELSERDRDLVLAIMKKFRETQAAGPR